MRIHHPHRYDRDRAAQSFSIGVLLTAVLSAAASELPLGHADFLPTPERPVGYRGDGTGRFPGANPPIDWDLCSGNRVRWYTTLPSLGCGAPTVVGDQVFVQCDPNVLVCVDARSGAIQWQGSADHIPLAAQGKAAEVSAQWARAQAINSEGYATAFERRWLQYLLAEAAGGAKDSGERKGDDYYPFCPPSWVLTADGVAQMKTAMAGVDAVTREAWQARLAELDAICAVKRYQMPHSYSFGGSPFGRVNAAELPPEGTELKELIQAVAPYGLGFESWASGYMSLSFQTPASDGTHVYANYSYGQALCFDLHGKLRWISWTPQIADKGKKIRTGVTHTNTNTSPVLVGDRFIYLHGNNLRALDKRTGALLWQVPTKPHAGHGLHRMIHARAAGQDLIVSSSGELFRCADGQCVEDRLGGTVSPPLVEGDIFYYTRRPLGGHGSNTIACFRITARDQDCLDLIWGMDDGNNADRGASLAMRGQPGWATVEKLKGNSETGAVFHGGNIVCPNGGIIDPASGKMHGQIQALDPRDTRKVPPEEKRRTTLGSDGGQDSVLYGDGMLIIGGKRGASICKLSGSGAEMKGEMIHEGNSIINAMIRDLYLLKITPQELGNLVRAGHHPHERFKYANKTPHGDRLYIRTTDALWCVGP